MSEDGTYFSKHNVILDYMFLPWNDPQSMQDEALNKSSAKTSAVQTVSNVKEDKIAAAESGDLSWYRLFIFIVLLLSMIGTAVAAYSCMSSNEQEKCTHHLWEDAKKVLGSIGKNLDVTLVTSNELYKFTLNKLQKILVMRWHSNGSSSNFVVHYTLTLGNDENIHETCPHKARKIEGSDTSQYQKYGEENVTVFRKEPKIPSYQNPPKLQWIWRLPYHPILQRIPFYCGA